MDGFPSGQREQTVNLPAPLSVVRIHPRPPRKVQGETQYSFWAFLCIKRDYLFCAFLRIKSAIFVLEYFAHKIYKFMPDNAKIYGGAGHAKDN